MAFQWLGIAEELCSVVVAGIAALILTVAAEVLIATDFGLGYSDATR
jgi:hypothetical protein